MAYDKVVDSAKLDLALTETANAIRGKAGGTEPITFDETQGFKNAIESIETGGDYDQGYEDGKNSVVDLGRFCNGIQFKNKNLFGKSEVVLDLDNATDLGNLFNINNGNRYPERINTTVEHITINTKKIVTTLNRVFYCDNLSVDTYLKRITFNFSTENCSTLYQAFNNMKAVEVIDGTPLDLSTCTNTGSMFDSCNNLIEVRFAPNSIKIRISFKDSQLLSDETIQSIIDGLADLTGQTTQTLTLHATVGGKLTEEQKATITAKNWTLVY